MKGHSVLNQKEDKKEIINKNDIFPDLQVKFQEA